MNIKRFLTLLAACSFFLSTPPLCAHNTKQPLAFTRNENFVYDYKTAIIHNDSPGFKLDDRVERVARIINRDLDQSMCFNTEFVKDVKKVRKYHLSTKKSRPENIGTLHWVTTADKKKLGCTYFNRNSSTLLVVAGGFTNEREMMTPFVDMFPDYDVVLMDWRGHGIPEHTVLDPIERIFSIAPREVTFGKQEHLDAFAVVEGFRQRKKIKNGGNGYTHVYGLGVCYAAFVFAKTASLTERLRFGLPQELKSRNTKMINATERELMRLNNKLKDARYKEVYENGLFDKLILDGCWLSLPLFVEKIKNDFATLVNPQTGGLSKHWLLSQGCMKKTINFIAANVVGMHHEAEINLLDYASTLSKTPLLFFFGKDDYMIRRHEFETLYNAIPAEKTVVLTSNYHVRNHFKQKELYKMASDLFFHLTHEEFIEHLQSPEKIVAYNAQHFLNACANVLELRKTIEEPDDLMWPLAVPESN